MENCVGCRDRCGITPTRIVDKFPTGIAADEPCPAAESGRRCAPDARVVEPLCSIVVLDRRSHRGIFKDGVGPARSVFSRRNSLYRWLFLPEGFTTLPAVHRQFAYENGVLRSGWCLLVAYCVRPLSIEPGFRLESTVAGNTSCLFCRAHYLGHDLVRDDVAGNIGPQQVA